MPSHKTVLMVAEAILSQADSGLAPYGPVCSRCRAALRVMLTTHLGSAVHLNYRTDRLGLARFETIKRFAGYPWSSRSRVAS